jgi:chondroitin 4-sulfotransferase 11
MFERIKYCFKPNMIFIHIPKNAGCSILKTMNVENFIHLTAKEVKNKIGCKKYNTAYTFAISRNPYSRLVSVYHYFKQMLPTHIHYCDYYGIISSQLQKINFEEFVLNFQNLPFTEYCHFRPQWEWVLDEENDIMVDQITKMEKMKSPIHNASQHDHWEKYYTQKLKDVVYNLYEKDFVYFNYKK